VPSGSATQSYLEAGDLVPVAQGHTYTITSWVYSPTGYASCNVTFDWFNAAGGCVSSTNGATTSVPGNT
jgi:hypothetical protein